MTAPLDEETLLSRFRQWLQEARADAEAPGREPPALDAEDHEVGLYRLVEEFTALRQAIEQFRAVEPRAAQAAWTASKPLAEALADLDEALDRGRVEIEKARRRLVEEPAGEVVAALDALFARQSWLRRPWVRSYHEQAREIVLRQRPEAHRPLFDALLEGYGLIQARLRRAMGAERLQRIDCVGHPVDPELMTVVEVVDDPERPPGQVVEEVRRGYTWQGRVLRYAEVRASRFPAPTWHGQSEPDQDRDW